MQRLVHTRPIDSNGREVRFVSHFDSVIAARKIPAGATPVSQAACARSGISAPRSSAPLPENLLVPILDKV